MAYSNVSLRANTVKYEEKLKGTIARNSKDENLQCKKVDDRAECY